MCEEGIVEMKEKPILYKDIMVKAILAGNKTQTRREKGLEDINENPDDFVFFKSGISDSGKKMILLKDTKGKIAVYSNSPYGWIGDRLWVREAFKDTDDIGFVPDENTPRYLYKADDYMNEWKGWTPSIHMPRKASRITLEIVDIRIERLTDISEQDAIAEGIEIFDNTEDGTFDLTNPDSYIARDYLDNDRYASTDNAARSFLSLWQKINGIGSYIKNPWVWVIVFKRVM